MCVCVPGCVCVQCVDSVLCICVRERLGVFYSLLLGNRHFKGPSTLYREQMVKVITRVGPQQTVR